MLLSKDRQQQTGKIETRNIALQLVMDLSTCLTTLFVSGALWQGLLLHCGLSAAAVGTLGAVASIAQALAMVLDLWLADRFKKPLVVMAIAAIPGMLFYGVISVLSFLGEGAFSFPVVLVSVLVYFSAYGFRSVFCYKLPYLIIRMEKYGPLTAVSGLTSNLLSTVVGLGINVLLEHSDYLDSMAGLYVICTVLAAVIALCTLLMRPIYAPREIKRVPVKEVLADNSVKRLAFANFVRGISSGIIGSITLIAAGVFEKDSAALSVMVTLTTVGAILGNLLFSFTSRPAWLSRMCLGASLTLTVIGPLSVFTDSWVLFLVLFVVIQIAFVIVNGTIPVMLAQSTPYQIIGGCTAVRMIETMLGTALSSWLAGLVLNHFDSRVAGMALMLVAGVTQLYCGIAYHRYQKSAKVKQQEG